MNAKQWQWLLDAANRIPELFGAIEQGNIRADANLGERVINGKHVRLYFVAEVVDPGRDPLESHASVNFPVHSKLGMILMCRLKTGRGVVDRSVGSGCVDVTMLN